MNRIATATKGKSAQTAHNYIGRTMFTTVAYTVEPLSRGQPRDQSKCPLNGVC